MLNFQCYRALIHFKPLKFHPLLPFTFQSSPLKLKFCTTASESESKSKSDSFKVSYLINDVGFPPEAALKASKLLRFNAPEKPDSVLNFFRSHGFSDSNIRDILTKHPRLLSSRPHISILPKFEFFLSKGVSASDIVLMLTVSPRFLQRSLEKRIIPQYELLKRFLKSDREIIAFIIRLSIAFCSKEFMVNMKLMMAYGVCDSSISRLLVTRPRIVFSANLLESLDVVKSLGFDPSRTSFGVALMAVKTVTKNKWDEKVDIFKKWGWSDETVL